MDFNTRKIMAWFMVIIMILTGIAIFIFSVIMMINESLTYMEAAPLVLCSILIGFSAAFPPLFIGE